MADQEALGILAGRGVGLSDINEGVLAARNNQAFGEARRDRQVDDSIDKFGGLAGDGRLKHWR